jgi:heme-degrading monooxygenase HmoA
MVEVLGWLILHRNPCNAGDRMNAPLVIKGGNMTETTHHDRVKMPNHPSRPYVLINSFTAKPGKLDELIAVHEAARDRFSDRIPGFHGSRIYRDTDGPSALLISVFETEEYYERWLATDLFAEHREQIDPLIESMGQSRIEPDHVRRA